MITKYIDLVGIELEGGWKKKAGAGERESPFPDFPLTGDVSVHEIPGCYHYGELACPALPLEKAIEFMASHYPDGMGPDCGMHIHISMKRNLDYTRLATQKFYKFFLEELKKWGETEKIPETHDFWVRWRGENRFCKKHFAPQHQINKVNKNDIRRTQLNFPYAMHGTVENRLFPMFKDVKLAESAVRCFVNMVEEWLPLQPKEQEQMVVVRVKDLEDIRSTKMVV